MLPIAWSSRSRSALELERARRARPRSPAPPPRRGGRSGARPARGRRPASQPARAQRQLAALGLGDRQQVLGELGEPVGLLGGRGQRRPQLLRRAALRPAPAPARCAGSPAACAARGWRRRRRRARARAPRRGVRASRSASCPAARPRRRVGGTGRRSSGSRGGDLRRPRAHRLDRLQRRGGDPVGGERGEEQGDRAADQEQLGEVGERLVARLGRGADDDDPLAAAACSTGTASRRDSPSQARAAGRGRRRSARAAPARSSAGVSRTRLPIASEESMTPPLASSTSAKLSSAADQAARARSRRPESASWTRAATSLGPRAQARVDRRVELGCEAQVDEDAGGAEDQRHHRGEDEGDAKADREAAQRPPSFRSR